MGTYIYSDLHPRKGTIPVLTFFPSLGGKPVVAMKSCVTIEGTTLQKVKVKEVKAIMDAYEQFLIPDIYVTDGDYDYALLVENLDNDSVPDKVKNCNSQPGSCFIGIIIDHDPRDGTYTVGCGPQVFTNVSSDVISINPKSEFPCVQIQRSFDSCIDCDNICDDKAEIKKLLDPAAAIFPKESLTSSHYSNKYNKGHSTPSLAAVPQAQSNPTKSSISKPLTGSATALSKTSLPQSQKVSKHLKPSVQQTQENASKTMLFKPFTGWSSTLKSESPVPKAQSTLKEISQGSTISRSFEDPEEDPWSISDFDVPFRNAPKTPITEFLLERKQSSTTNGSNLKPLTRSARKSTLQEVSQDSTSSWSFEDPEEDPWSISDFDVPFRNAPKTPITEFLLEPKQRSTTNGSNLKPLTRSASPLSFRSCNPQSQSNSNMSSNSMLSTSSANSCYRSVFSNVQTPSNSTKSTNSTFFTSSASSLTFDSREKDSTSPLSYKYLEEDPRPIPDPAEPFDRSGKLSIIECLNEQVQKSTIKSSQNAPKHTASSQFLKSLTPQTQTKSPKSLTPSTTPATSVSSIPQVYSSQSNPSLRYTAYTSPANGSDLEPISRTATFLRCESLLPQASHESTSQHTSPTRANEPALQAAASASSQMALDNFEALKPTVSSCEYAKLIEDLKTVTI